VRSCTARVAKTGAGSGERNSDRPEGHTAWACIHPAPIAAGNERTRERRQFRKKTHGTEQTTGFFVSLAPLPSRSCQGRNAHLEEGGGDGRAGVCLHGKGLARARMEGVRVVLPVEPSLVPAQRNPGDESVVLANKIMLTCREVWWRRGAPRTA